MEKRRLVIDTGEGCDENDKLCLNKVMGSLYRETHLSFAFVSLVPSTMVSSGTVKIAGEGWAYKAECVVNYV